MLVFIFPLKRDRCMVEKVGIILFRRFVSTPSNQPASQPTRPFTYYLPLLVTYSLKYLKVGWSWYVVDGGSDRWIFMLQRCPRRAG